MVSYFVENAPSCFILAPKPVRLLYSLLGSSKRLARTLNWDHKSKRRGAKFCRVAHNRYVFCLMSCSSSKADRTAKGTTYCIPEPCAITRFKAEQRPQSNTDFPFDSSLSIKPMNAHGKYCFFSSLLICIRAGAPIVQWILLDTKILTI